MTWMLMPMIPMLALHIGFLAKRLGRLSPSSLFLYMQFLMAVGTLPALGAQNAADQAHGWIILSTFTIFWATSAVLSTADSKSVEMNLSTRDRLKPYWIRPNKPIIALVALSLIVCVAYYMAVGYNVFAVGLGDAITGKSSDIASMRLQAYAGKEYFYPGYVNQFKNGLLPALICIIIPYLFVKRAGGRWLIATILSTATLTFILGTGQRGAFITFMITVLLYVAIMSRKRLRKKAIWVGAVTGLVFFISTFALGRSSSAVQQSTDPLERAGILLGEIVFRILGSNQLASVVGFRYIYHKPHVEGMEWWPSMSGLLPGVSGSTLSNEIFAQLYGSSRGTAPPSIWGATYYNFGLVGTLLFSILLAVTYHVIGRKIRSAASVSSVQAIGMAGVTTVLGTWVAGSPDYLLNSGLAVYVFLWIWGTKFMPEGTSLSVPDLTGGTTLHFDRRAGERSPRNA